MFEVFAKDTVAIVSSLGLFPVGVGFGKTSDVDLISCHIAGEQIEFSKVCAGVEAIGVLTDESHRIGVFFECKGVAPVLKIGGVKDVVLYVGKGVLGSRVGWVHNGRGSCRGRDCVEKESQQ
jgi:hypothetical protein